MNNWLKISGVAFITGIIVYLIGSWMFGNGYNDTIKGMVISFSIYQLYAFSLSFANAYFHHYISKVYSWKEEPKKRMIIGFLGSFLCTLVILVILRFVVVVYFSGGSPETFLENSKGYFIFGIVMTIIFSLAIHLFYFYKALTEKKVTESQVVAKTETAKYESLKSQLDPHFLFNSLNVLTSLIGENPNLAEKFTTKLSKVYRYVLEQKNKDLITFDEELSFAQTYMELLKMRFENAIEFEIPEQSTNPDFKIVPLSLQILLENAVKHNIISNDSPLKIRIYESDNYLLVENDLNQKSVLEKSTKVGLKNIQDRYALITQRPVFIEKGDDKFIVRLPLLTQKIKKMTPNTAKEDSYLRARRKLDNIKEFYTGLLAYCIFIPFIIFIWYKFTPHTFQWFWFPICAWGMGMVFQGFKAYGSPIFGSDWEERKIRQLMDKDNKQYWN